ncbi:hypothetical protein BHM03_00018822 [Ensete ventricosum]|nr:hypothetical protein BHM03_00018822 [Ensete ventricosum]
MLGTAQYSSIHTILIVDRYIGEGEKDKNLSTAARTSSARAVLEGFKQTSTADQKQANRSRKDSIIRKKGVRRRGRRIGFTGNGDLLICGGDLRRRRRGAARNALRLGESAYLGAILERDLHRRAHRLFSPLLGRGE